MKRPTRNDVAKMAGVSSATVSYVINNGPRPVAPETRARVLTAIKDLRYQPHLVAQSLRNGKTNTVGLLIQSLVPSYNALLINEIENNLARNGYGLILASSHESPQREALMLNLLVNRGIDGLLFAPTSDVNRELIKTLIAEGVKIVFVDRFIEGVPADAVMSDNVKAARYATEYLVNTGCKNFLCVSFSDEASSAKDRATGFIQALEDHQISPENRYVVIVKYAAGEIVENCLQEHFASHGIPDGIVCTTEDFMVSVTQFLQNSGISVPRQVRVVGGFNNSKWNELLIPPLPIVCQNLQRVAQRSVEILLDRIRGNEASPQKELIEVAYLHFDDPESLSVGDFHSTSNGLI